MLKAQLGNEFGNPASREYQQREEAFSEYNTLLERSPEQTARVMAALAMDEDISYSDEFNKEVYLASLRVLDTTNNGSQIGIVAAMREATWAEVFEDEGHQAAVHKYGTFTPEEKQTPEALEARRWRGLQALKVVAFTHLSEEERHLVQNDIHHNKRHQTAA